LTCRNGVIYDGGWLNDKKHGLGTQNYGNGTIYTGYWFEDQRSGNGKETDRFG